LLPTIFLAVRTGLTVEEHQRRTVANFVRLEQLWHQDDDVDLDPEAPFMPTVQGNTVGG
jgi:hypothetical protein